jgi:hypothetical protein
MSIFDRVKSLNLPLGKYVVIGGVMEAHGIRPARDIDLLVVPDLFKQLQKEGWKRKWFFWRTLSCKLITNGKDAEAFSTYQYKNYRPTTEELISRAEMINDIPFLPLTDLMAFKKELARAKDLRDVELIKSFLGKN